MKEPGPLVELKEIKSLPILLERVAAQASCVVRLLQMDGTAVFKECAKGPNSPDVCLAEGRRQEIIARWGNNGSPKDLPCGCGQLMTIFPIFYRDQVIGILTGCPMTPEKRSLLACIAEVIENCYSLARNAVELWNEHNDMMAAHREIFRETESLAEAEAVPQIALNIAQKYVKADVGLYLPRHIDGAGWELPIVLNDGELPKDWLDSFSQVVMSSRDEDFPLIILPGNQAQYPEFAELKLSSFISSTVFYEDQTLGRLVFCTQRPEPLLSFSNLALLETLGTTISLRIHDLHTRKFKERFLDRALHQINTPAHSVREIARLLTERQEMSREEREGWLRDLNTETERLARLAQQAREFSIWQKSTRQRTRLSLNELINQVSHRMRLLASQRQITIETEILDELCETEADAEALYGALENLVENAIKFSPPGTAIRITLVAEPAIYRINVMDQGPGVPESQREVIFQEFISIPRSAAPEGTGLGLTIARLVAEGHGGRLNYHDRPDQPGACFSLAIPRAEGQGG